MKKATWKVHAVATCEDCGKEFQNYHNAQALAAQHAKKYKHFVGGEVGLAFEYDGREKEDKKEEEEEKYGKG